MLTNTPAKQRLGSVGGNQPDGLQPCSNQFGTGGEASQVSDINIFMFLPLDKKLNTKIEILNLKLLM